MVALSNAAATLLGMFDLAALFVHLIWTALRLLSPGGARSVVVGRKARQRGGECVVAHGDPRRPYLPPRLARIASI